MTNMTEVQQRQKKKFVILTMASEPSIPSNYPFTQIQRNLQNICTFFFFNLAGWKKNETRKDHYDNSLYQHTIDFRNVVNF